jgi:hypothetical protein
MSACVTTDKPRGFVRAAGANWAAPIKAGGNRHPATAMSAIPAIEPLPTDPQALEGDQQ